MRQMGMLLVFLVATSLLMQPQTVVASSPPVGHVVYLTGDPSGVRAGRPLWLGVGLGLPVRPFDFFSTGPDDLLEIETVDAAGVLATVRLQPDSVVYLAAAPGAGERTHEIRLLSGSVSVFMRDANPVSQLHVVVPPLRVDAAGAAYDVTLAPGGDVLVTAGSGVVRVRDELRDVLHAGMRGSLRDSVPPGADSGDAGRGGAAVGRIRTLFADPERGVEFARDGTLRTVPMIHDRADRLRSVWLRHVTPRTEAEARQIRDDLEARIGQLLPQFESAYRSLMRRRDILDRWMETDRQERNPLLRPEVTAAEVREVGGELEAAYRSLQLLETAWYRFKNRHPAHADTPTSDTPASDTQTADRNQNGEPFAAVTRVLEEQMHMVRYAMRLYRERTAGLEQTAETAE